MLDTFRKLRALLSPREQRQALLLLAMMLVLGMVEMAGVASIFPLIAVLSDPSLVESNQWLKLAYDTLGFTSLNAFFIFLSAAVFALIVVRTLVTALTSYGLLRYAQTRSHGLSVRLLGSYLKRPYAFFLNRHSADMSKAVLSEVEQVISGSLVPALQLASQVTTAAFIMAIVIIVDPIVAMNALIGTAGAYGLVYFLIRRYLRRKGEERLLANRERFRVAQEVLAGVKEVKVGGLERSYLLRYTRASYEFSRLRTQLDLVREVPRHILELLAIGGVLLVILVLLFRADGNLIAVLPTMALYAFAGLRLLPALQAIYKAIVALRFGGPALDALSRDLITGEEIADLARATPMPVAQHIKLNQVSFSYADSERQALRAINLEISAHSTMGIVGPTGAGKSTLVDIILGLLKPSAGTLSVDGEPIDETNVRSWQQSIGYVPQQIFLTDESIASNIALGIPEKDVDMVAVERAARIANIHGFIASDLPLGYATRVGDRGVRLSGGQRQRIGIARALYRDPHVLVLDEATSALDNLNEKAVMDAVRNIAGRKTIILIAHRLSTVRHCDQIFLLQSGMLEAAGTYEYLMESNELFQEMVGATI